MEYSKCTITYNIPLKHFWLVMDVLNEEYDNWYGDEIYTEPDEDGCVLGLSAYRFIFPHAHKSVRDAEIWHEDEFQSGGVAEYDENEDDPLKFNVFYTGMIDAPSGNDDAVFHIDLAGKLDPIAFKKAVDEAIAEEEARTLNA